MVQRDVGQEPSHGWMDPSFRWGDGKRKFETVLVLALPFSFVRHASESWHPWFNVMLVKNRRMDGWTPAFAGVTERGSWGASLERLQTTDITTFLGWLRRIAA
jgi:hypothetical protein